MRRRISIRGRVRPSVGPSVRPSVRLSRVIFRRVLGASCAVYPALFHFSCIELGCRRSDDDKRIPDFFSTAEPNGKPNKISDSARKGKSNQRWEVVQILARKVDLQFSFENHNSKNIISLCWSSHSELCHLCYSQISSLHHCIILGVPKKVTP